MRKLLLVAGVALVALGCPAHADLQFDSVSGKVQDIAACTGTIWTINNERDAHGYEVPQVNGTMMIVAMGKDTCAFWFNKRTAVGKQILKVCPADSDCEIKVILKGPITRSIYQFGSDAPVEGDLIPTEIAQLIQIKRCSKLVDPGEHQPLQCVGAVR